jgi:hypothetical protein
MRSVLIALVSIALAFSVSSCGGDDDTSPAPPALAGAEGLWNGTTNNGRTVAGLVLDDGTYWFLYSLVGNPNIVAGMAQGSSTSQNGSFSSGNMRDFNLEGLGINDGSIAGNYVGKQILNGTVTYANTGLGQVIFTTTYDTDYDATRMPTLLPGHIQAPLLPLEGQRM